jgi:hypothetical protein
MQDAFPVILVIGAIAASVMLTRLASALAKRLEARPPVVTPPDPAIGELREELDGVRREVADLVERVDFAERILAKQRDAERLAPPKS